MFWKNFLGEGRKGSDRTLWVLGALSLALCAYLASGLFDSTQPATKDDSAVKAAKSVEESDTATDAAARAVKKTSWRDKKRAKAPTGPGVGSVWRTLGGLIFVLILMCLAAAFCKRFMKKIRMRPQGDKVLELVDVIPLGPKKQVFVLSAYGRRLVVGSTADSMSVLSEFGADEIEAVETEKPLEFATKLEQSMKSTPTNNAFLEVEA